MHEYVIHYGELTSLWIYVVFPYPTNSIFTEQADDRKKPNTY